jgi:tryptophan 2,3-dioxygenase
MKRMMTDQATGRRSTTSEYAQYACIDELLHLQWPRTEAPAELSFIITTQVMELYFKLLSHEWAASCAKLDAGDVRGAIVDLRRGHGVQDALLASWEALRTLTPAEFDEFRDAFGAASGIQSELYRDLEQALGTAYPGREDVPSLADASARLLERAGVEDGWRGVYAHSAEHPQLVDLGEALYDAAERFVRWKQRHLVSVWHSMGEKPGSAGTSGAEWLARGVHEKYLSELWDARGQSWV